MTSQPPSLAPDDRARVAAAEGVLFDLDGTLLASHEFSIDAAIEAFHELAERHGLTDPPPTRAHIQHSIGLPWREFYQVVLPQAHRERYLEYHDLIARRELAAIETGCARLFDGAHEVLAELRARGYRLACVSNASNAYFDCTLDHFGLRARFDHAACVGDGGVDKTELYRRACERLGLATACMIGDKPGDFAAAHAAGHPSLAITHGYGSPEECAQATGQIANLRQLLPLLPGPRPE